MPRATPDHEGFTLHPGGDAAHLLLLKLGVERRFVPGRVLFGGRCGGFELRGFGPPGVRVIEDVDEVDSNAERFRRYFGR